MFQFYLTWENDRRDKEQGVKIEEEVRRVNLNTDEDVLQVDQTDKQNRGPSDTFCSPRAARNPVTLTFPNNVIS